MAIDPDIEDAQLSADDQPPQFGDNQSPQLVTTHDSANTDFAAVEPDVDEAAFIGETPSAAERREIVCDGRAPLAGWRSDDFGSGGIIRRFVWATQ